MSSIIHNLNLVRYCALLILITLACSSPQDHMPRDIIDLSPTITEDMPVRLMGPFFFNMLGMDPTVEFKHFIGEPPMYYLDSYITLFNHAGPHADAPLHMIPNTAAIDEYNLEDFFGHARILDFSERPGDDFVTLEEIKAFNIRKGDIVIFYCGFKVTKGPDEVPNYTVPTKEAAEYLASLPVKCYATDGLAVDNMPMLIERFGQGVTDLEEFGPVHYAFLSKGVPIIEGLQNLDAITQYDEVVFAGFPLKTSGKAGDAAPMRAVALIY